MVGTVQKRRFNGDPGMSDIEEVQGRIMAAMERASRGLEKLAVAKEDVPDLSQELADERLANAQLEERVKSLNTQLETLTADTQAQLEKTKAELGQAQAKLADADAQAAQSTVTDAKVSALDVELQRVRQTNTKLSDACAALRAANAEGVGDADLINAALQAELDALRAARSADLAQADAILSTLTPLVEAAQENA
jgi:chromosome segregation ATPase|tara:strand:+ start:7995 stop:8582 length:588 start_codon:yes stop_codon:yes gene_type:complete